MLVDIHHTTDGQLGGKPVILPIFQACPVVDLCRDIQLQLPDTEIRIET
jgi:hypothetical protein